MPSSSRNRFNVSGSTRIVLHRFSCELKLRGLTQCYHSLRESSSCQSEVAMSCHPNAKNNTADGALRLVASTSRSHIEDTGQGSVGYLQAFHQGQWGPVCDSGFNYVAARVACKQLGFDTGRVNFFFSTIGAPFRNIPVMVDKLKCRGGESQLQYCSRNVFLDSNCDNLKNIVLDCDYETQASNGTMTNNIRLINSNVPGTGIVQLQTGGQWESVCDTLFSPANVVVACRQLGYDLEQSVVLPKVSYSFLSNNSRVAATHDSQRCYGNETSLAECTRRSCLSDDDVAISCVGNKIPGISNEEMLQIAIAMNDDEEVERLLSSGVSPDTIFERCCQETLASIVNVSALICAACYGSGGSVEALLRHGASVDATDPKGNTALIWAAFFRHQSIAHFLISFGANINHSNRLLQTPLHEAVLSGSLETVRMLVNFGANMEAQDSEGNTPEDLANDDDFSPTVSIYFQSLRGGPIVRDQFFPAIAIGNSTTVAELLRQGVDPNSVSEKCCLLPGTPAISCAACIESLEIVELLLNYSANVDKRDLSINGTALIWASRSGNLSVVQALVRNGANLDAKTIFKETSLLMAASRGHLDVVKYLVEQGADTQMQTRGGYTALQIAVIFGHTEIVYFLRRQNPGTLKQRFFEAIDEGNLTFVRQAISDGITVDSRTDSCGSIVNATALICAAYTDQFEIVKLLLQNGATVDERDQNANRTAMIWAARAGNVEIVKMLLDAGADINAGSKYNETALILAAYYGHFDTVRLLMESGINYKLTTDLGNAAEFFATLKYHFEIADYIGRVENFFNAIADGDILMVRNGLANGISVDMINYQCCFYGKAPALICAACVEEYEIVELLLDEGANIDGRDRQNGGTALIWASKEGNLPIVTLLVESGANVNAVTESGMDTSLHWAAFNGHFEVVKYVVEKGANVDIIQSGNMTAATLASDQGHHEISLYLLAHS